MGSPKCGLVVLQNKRHYTAVNSYKQAGRTFAVEAVTRLATWNRPHPKLAWYMSRLDLPGARRLVITGTLPRACSMDAVPGNLY
jgi:hypothetical protein